jgi:isocitrate/isopropylmalate dehydrogenase
LDAATPALSRMLGSTKTTITAIPGDGIGPEVMRAVQRVLAAAGANLEWEEAEAGAAVFKRGIASGCPQDTLDSIARTGIVLKGPLETPVGYGEKSANVTLRKFFELYGNIRPVRELPGIRTPFSGRGIDLVIVRENVEDLYTGIEHMQSAGAAQCLKLMVIAPEQFDVIVTTNMNGDIISDLAAGLVGGLGVAPSSNIGDSAAMFEAVHGSAPQIAGRDLANPTALLLSAVMMLRHIGDFAAAETVEQALLVTLEEGRNLTGDIAPRGTGVGTTAYTDQVIANLGRVSSQPSRQYHALTLPVWPKGVWHHESDSRIMMGLDVFIESDHGPEQLAASLKAAAAGTDFTLKMIENRGVQVWPAHTGQPFLVDLFRCRFLLGTPSEGAPREIAHLMERITAEHHWMHVEKLQRFDGLDGYTRAQGEN